MTRGGAATLHVVERCPCCGVEHEASADSVCEACDGPLRAWCRTHSRAFGWLDGPDCTHCDRETARRSASVTPLPGSVSRRIAAVAVPVAASLATDPPPAGIGVLRRPPVYTPRPTSGQTVLRNTVLVLAGGAAGGVFLGWMSVATVDQRWWAVVVVVGLTKAFTSVRRRVAR